MSQLEALAARSHVLVTGGSSGIGLALATEFVRRGAHVHLVARREAVLAEAGESLEAARRSAHQQIRTHVCDVTSEAAVGALFTALREAGTEPAIVVNSAGVTATGYFEELPTASFRHVMEVNYMGTLHVLKEAVPDLIARGEGYVLNIASVAALLGVYGMAPYCAAKFAVRGLTETLRSELKPHGVHVSLLCPPDTDTPMLEAELQDRRPETEALSRSAGVLTPEKVARVAVRGMARRQAVIVPGFDGRMTAVAQRLVPGLTEWISDRIVRGARHRPEGSPAS